MRTPSKRTVGLLLTVLGTASLGVSTLASPASAAVDSNPRTRELKDGQEYSTVGDVSDGDCGNQFDVDDGVIWHFIADKMVLPATLVSWTATFAATDGGPVIETVTATPEIINPGNSKTWSIYSQSQNLYIVDAVLTVNVDQTEVDMQLSHICGESVPGTTTTTAPSTTSTTVATTSTTLATTTTEAPTTTSTTVATTTTEAPTTTTSTTEAPTTTSTTEAPTTTSTTEAPTTTSTTEAPTTTSTTADVSPTSLVGGNITTTTTADPATTTSTTEARTEVSGVQIVRQSPAQLARTGTDARPFAYLGCLMIGVGIVLLGQLRRQTHYQF